MACFRCGDDENLIHDGPARAICVWCLQHRDHGAEEWGEDSEAQALERGPR